MEPEYDLVPVNYDPFERAAQRVRAPYEKANQRENGLPQVLDYYGNKIQSALTAPQDAFTGKLQVSDPETGMPTQEAMGRAGEVAGLTGIGSPFAVKGALGSAGGRLMQMENKYPMAPRERWYGEGTYEQMGGRMETMSPDQFLAKARPMKIDEVARENIDDLKRHIKEGGELDPLMLSKDGKEDGRHRAIAAKELGIKELPVINYREPEKAPPFYSALEHAVENTKQQKMPADQWLGTISNSKGVKPEELDWTGFKDFLADKGKQSVTKAEVQEHLNNNKVELKEVNKGFSSFDKDRLNELDNRLRTNGRLEGSEIQEYNRLVDAESRPNTGEAATKYSQYQLPGGENYREMLMTLPKNQDQKFAIYKDEQKLSDDFANANEARQWAIDNGHQGTGASIRQSNDPTFYKSSHWDEPNILAHVRMNDRNIEGKKSLHLEEIQSDWHQQGRDKGYRLSEEESQRLHNREQELIGKGRNATEAEKQEWADIRNRLQAQGVPDAPFKKSWHELALKRMIREAAEKGYDRLSWTPGEANRTNPKNLGQTGESAERADRGLKKFYDEIIPQAIEKIGKEHGVKVKTAYADFASPYSIDPKAKGGFWIYKDGEKTDNWFATKEKAQNFIDSKSKSQPVHYIDIPESLKNVATQKGFPLFASGLPLTFTPVDGDPHK